MSVLDKYLPALAVSPLTALLEQYQVHLKIVNERQTRHGDYRPLRDGSHKITINANLNSYRFLITLVHELAHLVAFKNFGYSIKPHGKEWKMTFQRLMLPYLRPEVFPNQLLPVIARHFKNPTASSDTDALMSIALKSYDPPTDKLYIFEIPQGAYFVTNTGRRFQKGKKLRKRFECKDLDSGKIFIFQPNVQVELWKR